MKKYASTDFERNKLNDDLITEMRKINDTRGIILTEPIQLYRGERRFFDDGKLRTISCDIGDCISSWSTSPEKAAYYAVKHLSVNRNFKETVQQYQSHDANAVLYCATFPIGTKVLPVDGLEMEVLFFQKAKISNDGDRRPSELQMIVDHSHDDDFIDYFENTVRLGLGLASGDTKTVSGVLVPI